MAGKKIIFSKNLFDKAFLFGVGQANLDIMAMTKVIKGLINIDIY